MITVTDAQRYETLTPPIQSLRDDAKELTRTAYSAVLDFTRQRDPSRLVEAVANPPSPLTASTPSFRKSRKVGQPVPFQHKRLGKQRWASPPR